MLNANQSGFEHGWTLKKNKTNTFANRPNINSLSRLKPVCAGNLLLVVHKKLFLQPSTTEAKGAYKS